MADKLWRLISFTFVAFAAMGFEQARENPIDWWNIARGGLTLMCAVGTWPSDSAAEEEPTND